MNVLVGYLGRANSARILLLKQGRPVSSGFERAVIRFGEWCVDTSAENHPAQIVESGKAVDVQIGLIPGLRRGQYTARLTVYDQENPEGLAWPTPIGVFIQPWDACEVTP